jgi:hypothetical protein
MDLRLALESISKSTKPYPRAGMYRIYIAKVGKEGLYVRLKKFFTIRLQTQWGVTKSYFAHHDSV